MTLEDTDDGRTKLTARASAGVGGVPRFVIGPMQRSKVQARARALPRRPRPRARAGAELPVSRDQPATVWARHLLTGATEEVTTGPRTPSDRALIAQRATRLREAGVAPEVIERLTAHLAERPDDEVSQMRPFELARLWGARSPRGAARLPARDGRGAHGSALADQLPRLPRRRERGQRSRRRGGDRPLRGLSDPLRHRLRAARGGGLPRATRRCAR
ncbi:MAG: hypothetical protein M5U28_53695 [Sandaracinaceae bacterium]|nr:hypothetical protein [Sandaracinaceae bacterium]